MRSLESLEKAFGGDGEGNQIAGWEMRKRGREC